MNHFVAHHEHRITGVLRGFDCLVFRGILRPLSYAEGFKRLRWRNLLLLKDFWGYAQGVTTQRKDGSLRATRTQGQPIESLASSETDKKSFARKIAQRDGIASGLIAVLTCVEPRSGFDIHRNRDLQKSELIFRFRKGLAPYHYLIHPLLGFMHARIQSWLIFTTQIGLNGHECLPGTMASPTAIRTTASPTPATPLRLRPKPSSPSRWISTKPLSFSSLRTENPCRPENPNGEIEKLW